METMKKTTVDGLLNSSKLKTGVRERKPSKSVVAQASKIADLAATIPEWGCASHGYRLVINSDAVIVPSLWVLDVETNEADDASFVGLALIDLRRDAHQVYYFSGLSASLKDVLAKSSFIGHNVKSDLHWFQQWGIPIKGSQIHGDTMIMAYCQNTTEENYGLKIQAKNRLGWVYPSYRDLVGKGAKKATLDTQAIELVAAYCGMDAAATAELYKAFEGGSDRSQQRRFALSISQRGYYANIELPVYQTLFDMETKGAHLDVEYIKQLDAEFLSQKSELLGRLQQFCGEAFNPGSPKQVQETLFKKLGIKADKTDKKVLKANAKYEPIQNLLKYREVSKLASTYTGALLALPTLPRVHARFNQISVDAAADTTTGIRTGRLSSSEPNLQNIPTRTEMGAKLRQAFTAPDGKVLLCADYSQVEYRLLAHFTNEQKLIDAFTAGCDVHEETGKALGVSRDLGKTLNFAAIYGAGAGKIAATAGISEEAAEGFLAKYWKNLPGVRTWINSIHARGYAHGGVTTLYKRFIPIKEFKSLSQYDRWFAERASVNYIVQGSAAEIMKVALLRLRSIGLLPTLTVHDELIFEVDDSEQAIQATKEHVENIMMNVVKLKVPLVVEAGWGKTWRDAK